MDRGTFPVEMASARDVAGAIRDLCQGSPGNVKVHKLLYYCQAWHALWTGEPLFKERIEAWKMGPVVADLWREEKYDQPLPPSPLTNDEMRTVRYVIGRYGQRWGNELIGATHAEAPWRDVYIEGGNVEITIDSMTAFFREDEGADQAWYWDPTWIAGEREADEDIRKGRTSRVMTADEFLSSL